MATPTEHSALRSWLGVCAITASLFVFLTTELMPVGILTPISASLHVQVGVAGLMVTLYGLSAGLGVPFIVAWSRRVNRRALLSALLAVLTLGNLATALAPNFESVLTARLLTGFANGVFWAIGVNMAMRLVPQEQAGRAAAITMSGISIATVLGMPLGTFLESLTTWRTTFLIWSGMSALVFIAVAALVPSLPSSNTVPVRDVLGLPLENRPLRLVMITVMLFVLGHFGAFTYVRPFLEKDASASPDLVTGLLMIFGAGGAIGNFIAGHTAKSNLRTTFLTACSGLFGSLLLLAVAGRSHAGPYILLLVWGLSFGAWQLCQINMTLNAAPEAFEAAMSLNTMAYNTSIALGAMFGGLFVDGFGVKSVLWYGVALTGASLLFTLGTRRAASQPRPGGEVLVLSE